jgi:hypothetical protein
MDGEFLRFMTVSEFAAREGISLPTAKRALKAKDGPQVTQLSPRRIGIRIDHYREYCDRRVRKTRAKAPTPAPHASPTP